MIRLSGPGQLLQGSIVCEETPVMLHDDLRDGKSQCTRGEVSLSRLEEGRVAGEE